MSTIGHCDAAYKKMVILQCCDALEAQGFTRFRKDEVHWPLGDGFYCWVGLSSNLSRESVGIDPFVGVHVGPIEKLWTRLQVGKYPVKYDRGCASHAVYMGLLSPRERSFEFSRQTDVAREAARLAQIYSTTGLSFARSIASYEQLLPLFKDRAHMGGAYPQRVACCLYLMGRSREARTFVDELPPVQQPYLEGFTIPFLNMLAEDERSQGERAATE
ncbi:MAG: hypothetical protein WDO12_10170 [Pseudomonadota bacterium]